MMEDAELIHGNRSSLERVMTREQRESRTTLNKATINDALTKLLVSNLDFTSPRRISCSMKKIHIKTIISTKKKKKKRKKKTTDASTAPPHCEVPNHAFIFKGHGGIVKENHSGPSGATHRGGTAIGSKVKCKIDKDNR